MPSYSTFSYTEPGLGMALIIVYGVLCALFFGGGVATAFFLGNRKRKTDSEDNGILEMQNGFEAKEDVITDKCSKTNVLETNYGICECKTSMEESIENSLNNLCITSY